MLMSRVGFINVLMKRLKRQYNAAKVPFLVRYDLLSNGYEKKDCWCSNGVKNQTLAKSVEAAEELFIGKW